MPKNFDFGKTTRQESSQTKPLNVPSKGVGSSSTESGSTNSPTTTDPKSESFSPLEHFVNDQGAQTGRIPCSPPSSAEAEVTLTDEQIKAVDLMRTGDIGAITGGAGVGKTTCLLAALQQLPEDVVDIALAAPTGKAAKRMNEVTGRPAFTVHRLLKLRPGGSPEYHAFNPLPYKVIIVDEASMLDTELAAMLFDAIPLGTARVFFIGDANQLPSVSPGQVFDDLVQSEKIPVVRLTEVHRSMADSWVCTNGPRILKGEASLETTHDFEFIEIDRVSDLAEQVADKSAELHAQGVDHQVLTAQNRGRIGVVGLNLEIQSTLEREGESMTSYFGSLGHELQIYRGDRVIQLSNNYDLNVFNGEMGTVSNIHKGEMLIGFTDGEVRRYKRDDVWKLGLSYVISTHRSQGSGFDHVIVVCHHEHRMWSRSLLYTAITRAKKRVTIMGSRQGVENALTNTRGRYRDTGLKSRLVEL